MSPVRLLDARELALQLAAAGLSVRIHLQLAQPGRARGAADRAFDLLVDLNTALTREEPDR